VPDAKISLFDLEEIQEQLAKLFDRSVNLIEKSTIKPRPNWIHCQEILKTPL
jgi:predicted nucleotidyltransferase